MAADGSRRYLAYVKETTAGSTPSNPTLETLRVTGGDSINNARSSITSDEIRDDRQIIISRLGQNQPEVTVPIELSFESFDELIAGACGDVWVGDYDFNTVTVDVTGATFTHDSATAWDTLNVAVGDWIVVDGLTATAEDGVYYVSALSSSIMTLQEADKSTAATFTTATDEAIRMTGGFTGGRHDASANNLTVDSTAKTITAASSAGWMATHRLSEGDSVFFDGFAQAGNNGWHMITAITDTVLTFGNSTLTNETLSTGDLDFSTSSAMTTTGVTLPTYTIEEGFVDVDEYHNMSGAKITTMSMSIQPDSIITGEFAFTGQNYVPFRDRWQTPDTPGTGTSIGASRNAANTNQVFDSYTGSLIFDGEDVGSSDDILITGLDFTLDNGVDRRFALLDRNSKSLSQGRITCTGTVSAFFGDANLTDKFDQETEFEIRVRLEDLDDNSYLFGWPKAKFTSESKTISETDVTLSLDISMLGGDTYYNTMYVKKQPKTTA